MWSSVNFLVIMQARFVEILHVLYVESGETYPQRPINYCISWLALGAPASASSSAVAAKESKDAGAAVQTFLHYRRPRTFSAS